MKIGKFQTLIASFAVLIVGLIPGHVSTSHAQVPQCGAVTQAEIDDVFNQALTTITNLSNRAVRLRDRGVWRPDRNFADTFLRRGARSLKRIRTLLSNLEIANTVCDSAEVSACQAQSVPKKKLLRAFDAIYSVSFPRGLESLKNRQKAQRRRFRRKVAALESVYTVCS